MTAPDDPCVPPKIGYSAEVSGLSTKRGDVNPTSLVQWSAVTPAGQRYVYGDQPYVASGEVLRDVPGGRIEYREVTITYGEWIAI